MKGGARAEEAVVVVDEIDEPVVDPLVIRDMRIGRMDPRHFGEHLLERSPLAEQIEIDLAGADLVARKDSILEPCI